ncbi:hypothetical protein E1301_Tti000054 [Triplophysa tibetana]|uniref:Protein FAM240A n=1 Tax=Triplophysa tibetana TaxID=1572043 RepID=A0A5A9N2M8_9TELE|nr:hypothetical protein E1301_Tti000054 [Triplophysa tibetana]
MMRWTEEQRSLCQRESSRWSYLRVHSTPLTTSRWTPCPPDASMMNSARIHDKCTLKKFWEQKIEKHVERKGNEDSRMKTSALSKLREEWILRLQNRNQHLIETTREEELRKAKRVQAILTA